MRADEFALQVRPRQDKHFQSARIDLELLAGPVTERKILAYCAALAGLDVCNVGLLAGVVYRIEDATGFFKPSFYRAEGRRERNRNPGRQRKSVSSPALFAPEGLEYGFLHSPKPMERATAKSKTTFTSTSNPPDNASPCNNATIA
jgi:hypothetical protein